MGGSAGRQPGPLDPLTCFLAAPIRAQLKRRRGSSQQPQRNAVRCKRRPGLPQYCPLTAWPGPPAPAPQWASDPQLGIASGRERCPCRCCPSKSWASRWTSPARCAKSGASRELSAACAACSSSLGVRQQHASSGCRACEPQGGPRCAPARCRPPHPPQPPVPSMGCCVAQVSDWGRRPLSEQQVRYAALDAHAAVLIFRGMGQLHHPFKTRQGLARHVFSVDTRQGPAARHGENGSGGRNGGGGGGHSGGGGAHNGGHSTDHGSGSGGHGIGPPHNGSHGSNGGSSAEGCRHQGNPANGANGSDVQAAFDCTGGSKGPAASGVAPPTSNLGSATTSSSMRSNRSGSTGIAATHLPRMRPSGSVAQRRSMTGSGAVLSACRPRPARKLLPGGVGACALLVPSLLRLLRPCPPAHLARVTLLL